MFFYKDGALEHYAHEEGRVLQVDNGADQYEYWLRDHLGNTRISFDESGTILQTNHYYPFGMRMGGADMNYQAGTENRYLYNGKELHREEGLGWYDYGFRWYDPAVARFVSVDPLAEDFPELTTYQYAGNTPIWAIDLDGLEPYKSQYIYSGRGDIIMSSEDITTQTKVIRKTISISPVESSSWLSGVLSTNNSAPFKNWQVFEESNVVESRNYDVEPGKVFPREIDTENSSGEKSTVKIIFGYGFSSDNYRSPDNFVDPDLVDGYVKAVKQANKLDAGIESLMITSTTNGKHFGLWNQKGKSRHYIGKAVDTGLINGNRPQAGDKIVSDSILETTLRLQGNFREVYGPYYDVKSTKNRNDTVDAGHATWIHFSIK